MVRYAPETMNARLPKPSLQGIYTLEIRKKKKKEKKKKEKEKKGKKNVFLHRTALRCANVIFKKRRPRASRS